MDQNIYTADVSNIRITKLVFKEFKTLYHDNLLGKSHKDILLENVSHPVLNFNPEFVSPKFKTYEAEIDNKLLFASSSLQKRKFEEIERDKYEFQNTFSHNFLKISDSNYQKENYWEQYTSLKPYTIKNYSSLLPSVHHKDNLSSETHSFFKSTFAVSPSKHFDEGKANATHIEDIFTTAAGKSISISNNAMLVAQRLIQSVFQDETNHKIDRDANCISVKNKHFNKVPTLINSSVISCPNRNHNNDEITTVEIDSKSVHNNHELDVNYDTDCVSFSTAAGKTVNVSETAMKAAHKLIQDAFENNKIMPSTSGTCNTSKKRSAFKNIGCPPKKLLIDDDTKDKELLEKFFQDDAFFDEKESQDTTESSKDRNFDKVLEAKTNNYPTTHKIRKSLGGRRSMRFSLHT